jgi:lysophospholipase L1-like esterase
MSAQSEPLEWDGKTAPVLTNSFTEAYVCMIKKIQTNYPNAIVIACSTWFTMRGEDNGYTLTHTSNGHVYTQADYDRAIENVCKQMRIPYICVNDIGFNRNNFYPTYASDSATIPTHTNAAGQRVMGLAVAEKILPLVAGYEGF